MLYQNVTIHAVGVFKYHIAVLYVMRKCPIGFHGNIGVNSYCKIMFGTLLEIEPTIYGATTVISYWVLIFGSLEYIWVSKKMRSPLSYPYR